MLCIDNRGITFTLEGINALTPGIKIAARAQRRLLKFYVRAVNALMTRPKVNVIRINIQLFFVSFLQNFGPAMAGR